MILKICGVLYILCCIIYAFVGIYFDWKFIKKWYRDDKITTLISLAIFVFLIPIGPILALKDWIVAAYLKGEIK